MRARPGGGGGEWGVCTAAGTTQLQRPGASSGCNCAAALQQLSQRGEEFVGAHHQNWTKEGAPPAMSREERRGWESGPPCMRAPQQQQIAPGPAASCSFLFRLPQQPAPSKVVGGNLKVVVNTWRR